MMSFPIYGPENVHALLDYEGCIKAVGDAMARFTADGTPQPLRSIAEIAPGRLFGLMPGALTSPDGFGAKVISVYENPARSGHTAHRGIVLLFDRDSGEIACIADAAAITEIRTAAASAVATAALARDDAVRLAIFGCGVQAAAHIRAISLVRQLEEVIVWGRSHQGTAAFSVRMADETGLRVRPVVEGRDAAAGADIICTVTASSTPVLLREWVQPGTHINAVGSSHPGPVEVDSDLVVACRYVADSRRSALVAAAEFLVARQAGLVDDGHIVAEIGDVLLGRIRGRISADEITFYKSLGHVVQDLAAAAYVHQRATGSGTPLRPAPRSVT